MRARTSVIGIGNVLLGDDGAGVWLARHLATAYRFEPDIQILDGGTLGLDLIAYVAETDRLIVIDAATTSAPAGTMTILSGSDVPGVMRSLLSAHEASLCDLLAALTLIGRTPVAFVAVGIEPLRIHPSLELSDPVLRALPQAERAVIEQLESWHIECRRIGASRKPILTLTSAQTR